MSLQTHFGSSPSIEGSTIAAIIGSNGLIHALSSSTPLKTEKKHHLQFLLFGNVLLTWLLTPVILLFSLLIIGWISAAYFDNDFLCFTCNGGRLSNSNPLALIFMTAMVQISEMRDVNNLF